MDQSKSSVKNALVDKGKYNKFCIFQDKLNTLYFSINVERIDHTDNSLARSSFSYLSIDTLFQRL